MSEKEPITCPRCGMVWYQHKGEEMLQVLYSCEMYSTPKAYSGGPVHGAYCYCCCGDYYAEHPESDVTMDVVTGNSRLFNGLIRYHTDEGLPADEARRYRRRVLRLLMTMPEFLEDMENYLRDGYELEERAQDEFY